LYSCKKVAAFTVAVVLLSALAASLALAVDVAPGVSVKGYMQNRFYAGPGSNPQFRSERISLSAIGNLPNESTAYAEVYYHPWAPASGLYLESAYYDTGLGQGRVRIGKGRRMTFGITPAWPNRKTSNYGIVSEAFTQDRIQGVQYMLQKDVLDFGIALQTGYRLGTRNIGEIPGDSQRNPTHQVAHLAFRDANAGGGSPSSLNRKLAVSTRVGGKWGDGLRAGASLYMGSLDPADVTSLTSAGPLVTPTGAPSLLPAGTTSDTQRVWGLDASYKLPSGFVTQGEWYDAKVSALNYDAWNVLAGLELPSGWKFFARYAEQNIGVAPTANQLSWDVQQVSLSMVQPLRKGLWLQYEYEINSEDPPPGISSIKNNLFFVELFTGF
jgi:hypothetical protein